VVRPVYAGPAELGAATAGHRRRTSPVT